MNNEINSENDKKLSYDNEKENENNTFNDKINNHKKDGILPDFDFPENSRINEEIEYIDKNIIND